MTVLAKALCFLGQHDEIQEPTRDGPVPGISGGVQRWAGFRIRCRRCNTITSDLTYPPWATKEACEWWEGRPFGAVWAPGTKPD